MNHTSLAVYSRAAEAAAAQIINAYSTSFGLATRLLGRRHRHHIRNIYALVRVADELVDGVGAEAGLSVAEQSAALDRLLAETHRAIASGFSTDLVVHAFANTARVAGIDASLVEPFFDSMRTDLEVAAGPGTARFSAEAHDSYVYGSAEVVGLMCLRVFVRDESLTPVQAETVDRGARALGAAFQDVNFLRDLADDTHRLGRSYLGEADRLTTDDKDRWVHQIRGQLGKAMAALPLLPRDARVAVRTAALLFEELANRIDITDVDELYRKRVRVPDLVKARLIGRAVLENASRRNA